MVFLSALLLGLMGSFHCVGMCGPLALALPIEQPQKSAGILKNLLYQLGRATTYAFMGLVLGLMGAGAAFAGMQQWVSIGAGIFIVVFAFLPLHLSSPLTKTRWGRNWVNGLQKSLRGMLKKSSNRALFGFGLVNGLLPCGLVYMALAGALAVGDPIQSAGFMFLFGMGTAPLLFATVWAGQWITVKVRQRFQRVVPYVVALVGVLMILRGLGLGIPYISPPDGALQIRSGMNTEMMHEMPENSDTDHGASCH